MTYSNSNADFKSDDANNFILQTPTQNVDSIQDTYTHSKYSTLAWLRCKWQVFD